ncbi:MAG TPA: methyltransferase domain-containing protein [Gaiellaceae bacterium]|nr:methyltransferase domain-containing protein [Gaiellaceae bacterium]
MSDDDVANALAGLEQTRDRVLDGAAIRPGDAVLDVGAGTGLLALGAVERAGPDGDVFALDVSVDALDALRRSSDAPTLWYLLGDAAVLPLPDSSVDVAMTRSVLIYVDDVEAAVGEFRRVLRGGGRLSSFEPLNRRGTYMHDVIDWSPLGELGERVLRDDRAFVAHDPISQLDADELVDALARAGFVEVRADIEDVEEPWVVTEASVDARLDAVGAPGHPSRRERWQSRYEPEEVDLLVAHVKSLAGQTLPLRWAHLWVTARLP